MTARARRLGMSGTTFRNASGLPDAGQHTTARDMALLGMALRSHFPHHFRYFSEREFAYRGRRVRGHNDLLGRVEGVDGIKTGYIRASGYNIVTSVSRRGRNLVIVVMGADSARARNARVEELMERFLPNGFRRLAVFPPVGLPRQHARRTLTEFPRRRPPRRSGRTPDGGACRSAGSRHFGVEAADRIGYEAGSLRPRRAIPGPPRGRESTRSSAG